MLAFAEKELNTVYGGAEEEGLIRDQIMVNDHVLWIGHMDYGVGLVKAVFSKMVCVHFDLAPSGLQDRIIYADQLKKVN